MWKYQKYRHPSTGLEINVGDREGTNFYTAQPPLYSEKYAKIIVDAGNTYNKTQLLPSELLEQRNELLECLKYVNRTIERNQIHDWFDIRMIQSLISKIEK